MAWPLVDRRAVCTDRGGLLDGEDLLDRATDMAQGRLGTKWNPFSLAGGSHPSHRPKGNGKRLGPTTSAVTGHKPRRRGSWIPGSLAPGCKLAAWISTDPIENFSQVQSPDAGLTAQPRGLDPNPPRPWNTSCPPCLLPKGPQTLIISLDSGTSGSPGPTTSPRLSPFH